MRKLQVAARRTISACPRGGCAMQLEELITVTPDVRNGKPCIAGTYIAVDDILEYWPPT